MKRVIFITPCLLLATFLSAQPGFSFIEEGKIWADLIKTSGTPPPGYGEKAWTDYYKFDGDTLIQGKTYHFLYVCKKDSTMTNWDLEYDYYREDSNKVYKVDWWEGEIKIYDFNLEVGDSMFLNDVDGYVHVSAVDSTLISGTYRKTIHFDEVDDIWVAGLGSLLSSFDPLTCCFFGGNMFELLCVSDSTGQIYQNPSYHGCYVDTLLTGTQESTTRDRSILIYPNPINTSCNIKISGIDELPVKLILIDNLGRIVRDEEVDQNSFIFHRNDLKPGFYLLKILYTDFILNKNLLIH